MCRNYYGQTPLHIAVIKKYPDIVQMLVQQYNVDVNLLDNNNKTPLDYCEDTQIKEIIVNPIFYMLYKCTVDDINYLFSLGVVDLFDPTSITNDLLNKCVMYQKYSIVNSLINYGTVVSNLANIYIQWIKSPKMCYEYVNDYCAAVLQRLLTKSSQSPIDKMALKLILPMKMVNIVGNEPIRVNVLQHNEIEIQ